MKTLPKVSIIFPDYNGGKITTNCLKSIDKLAYPKDKIETIIVNNYPKIDLKSMIKQQYPQVRVITAHKNLGFAKAINLGANLSTGHYLLITNNDVIFAKNSLKRLINFLQNSPHVGIVGPKIYDLQNKNKVIGPPLYYHFYTGTFTLSGNTQKIMIVDWVQGCGFCVSKKLWQLLGGFDEGFFFTGEELDFCLRAKYQGYQTVYYPNAKIWHASGATINQSKMAQFKYYEGYKSKIRIILKHANILQITTALLLQYLIFAPVRRILFREKSLKALMAATAWNIKNLKKTLSVRQKKLYAILS